MKLLLLAISFVAISAELLPLNNGPSPISDPIRPHTLKFIATVDGKSFFSDFTQGSWSAMADYCKVSGLKLASISSREQYSALNASFSENDFKGYYWTSGRDAMSAHQFSWNETDIGLSSDYLQFESYAPIHTCVLFKSQPGDSLMRSYECTDKTVYPLCETP